MKICKSPIRITTSRNISITPSITVCNSTKNIRSPFNSPVSRMTSTKYFNTPFYTLNSSPNYSPKKHRKTNNKLLAYLKNPKVLEIVNWFNNRPSLVRTLEKTNEDVNTNCLTPMNVNYLWNTPNKLNTKYNGRIKYKYTESLDDIRSKKLSRIFYNKTNNIIQEMKVNVKKEEEKWTSTKRYSSKEFRKKIIKDYSDRIFSIGKLKTAKQNYEKGLELIEKQKNKAIEEAHKLEENFYNTKFKISDITPSKNSTSRNRPIILDSINSTHKYTTLNEVQDDKVNKFATAILWMDAPEYEKWEEPSNGDTNVNYRNLNRIIKLNWIQQNNYDEDNDDLLIESPIKWKQILKESNEKSNYWIRNSKPLFLKTKFSAKTVKKFKSFNGVYFG